MILHHLFIVLIQLLRAHFTMRDYSCDNDLIRCLILQDTLALYVTIINVHHGNIVYYQSKMYKYKPISIFFLQMKKNCMKMLIVY